MVSLNEFCHMLGIPYLQIFRRQPASFELRMLDPERGKSTGSYEGKKVFQHVWVFFFHFFLYFKYIFMGLWMYTGKKYNANFILVLQLVVLLIEQTIIERVNIFALQSVKACEVLSSVNTVSRGV